jgi:multiple sugar transport system ATP-binding protein
MNLVEATIDRDEIVFGQYRAPLDSRRRPARSVARVVLGIRPETFEDAAFARGDMPTLEAHVAVVEELGSDAHLFFDVDAQRITAESLESAADEATLLAEAKALFNARVDPRTTAQVGDRLRLAVDPSRFHFFDPETGASLIGKPGTDQPTGEPAIPAPVTAFATHSVP